MKSLKNAAGRRLSHSPRAWFAIAAACVFLFASGAVRAATLEFKGEQPTVASSLTPNPAWSAAQVVDGDFAALRGWLGSWTDGGPSPWVRVTLPEPVRLDGLGVAQAGFRETGERRFMRPKRISVAFDNSENRLLYELRDNEIEIQELGFEPRVAQTVTIWIESVYEDAQTQGLAGFQEIVFHGQKLEEAGKPTTAASGSGGGGAAAYKTSPPASLPAEGAAMELPFNAEIAKKAMADGKIDEEEARILQTMQLLMQQLTEYFSKD